MGTTNDDLMIRRLQAVGEPTRLRIVRLLAGGEHCVCDIQEDLGAAQSRLSFHLRRLKDAGVVSDRRQGRWAYYSLVPGAVEELRSFLATVEGFHGEMVAVGTTPSPAPAGCCCGGGCD